MVKHLHVFFIWALIQGTLFGCSRPEPIKGFDPDAGINNLPDGDIPNPFRVTLVEPSHGPAEGGTEVTIRGFGFMENAKVAFGSRWADPTSVVMVSPTRLLARVPAGEVGTVEVTVMQGGGEQAILADGFTYDRYSVDPGSGAVTGGTFIRVNSPLSELEETDVLYLGENRLSDVRILTAAAATARTPPSGPGSVALRIEKADGDVHVVPDAFAYYDTTDPAYGGFGGGPLDGSMTVTVLNLYGRVPVPDALVLLGASAESPFSGRTDSNGQITFSDPSLRGRQVLTVAKDEFITVSMVGFDARHVTLFLEPSTPPGDPGNGQIPSTPTNVYSQIVGAVDFKDAEFRYSCNWNIQVPQPAPEGYQRVVRVLQTLSSYNIASPAVITIRDTDMCVEDFGHPILLTVWPGSFALVAIAGYEKTDKSHFIPVSYGITRRLVVGPGEVVNAKVSVEYPRNNRVNVSFANPPPLDPDKGPKQYRNRLFVNIGSDGYIVLDNALQTTDADPVFVYENQMFLTGPLFDAQFALFAEAHNHGQYPFSRVFLSRFTENPKIVNTFLTIPTPIAPVTGTPPVNGRFSFEPGTTVQPTFFVVRINTFPKGDAWWRLYVHGQVHTFVLPDLRSFSTVPQRPSGWMYWHVQSALVPELSFDDFTYRYLAERYWAASAADGSLFSFQETN